VCAPLVRCVRRWCAFVNSSYAPNIIFKAPRSLEHQPSRPTSPADRQAQQTDKPSRPTSPADQTAPADHFRNCSYITDATPFTVYSEVPINFKERACWELQPSRPTSPADRLAQQTD